MSCAICSVLDVYRTTRHGTEWSASGAGARRPGAGRGENNGPEKGGTVEAWGIIHSTPGFQDLWQLHYSELVDNMEHNPRMICS